MSELFGAIKLLIFTVLLVMFLQVKVGGRTLEARAHLWIQTSSVGQYLGEVATGTKKFVEDTQKNFTKFYQKNF